MSKSRKNDGILGKNVVKEWGQVLYFNIFVVKEWGQVLYFNIFGHPHLETREGAGGWAKKCCDKKGKAQSGDGSAAVLQCCSDAVMK